MKKRIVYKEFDCRKTGNFKEEDNNKFEINSKIYEGKKKEGDWNMRENRRREGNKMKEDKSKEGDNMRKNKELDKNKSR